MCRAKKVQKDFAKKSLLVQEYRRPKTDFCFPIEIKHDYIYELKRKEKKKSGKVGIEKETEGEEK